MAITEAQKRAHEKYIAKAYDSVSIRWPREFCDRLRAAAEHNGQSIASYVREAIEQRMENEQ